MNRVMPESVIVSGAPSLICRMNSGMTDPR
jgi:hypothetical protein